MPLTRLFARADKAPAFALYERLDAVFGEDEGIALSIVEHDEEAGILDTDARLSINFLPNAVYSPVACIQLTLRTARAAGMPIALVRYGYPRDLDLEQAGAVALVCHALPYKLGLMAAACAGIVVGVVLEQRYRLLLDKEL